MVLACAVPFVEPGSHGVNLEEIHDFAVGVALQAGSFVRRQGREQAARSRTDGKGAAEEVQQGDFKSKESDVDLVTKVDLSVEEFVRSKIQGRWPHHAIVGEESYSSTSSTKYYEGGRGPTWWIDPLDGTLNYTHLLQLHCISIGFSCSHSPTTAACLPSSSSSLQRDLVKDDALVGVIFAPSLGTHGTLWSGARGKGSYLSYPSRLPRPNLSPDVKPTDHGCNLGELSRDSQKVSLGETEDEDESSRLPPQQLPLELRPLPQNAPSGILLASEWGKDRKRGVDGLGNLSRKLETMTNLAASDNLESDLRFERSGEWNDTSGKRHYVHGVRSLGSSALDLAFCAQGSIDVLWEGGCWEWDVCAGIAVILEAGGVVTDSNPPDLSSSLFSVPKSETCRGSHVPRAELGARRFLAVRGCIGTDDEKSLEAQERVVRSIWARTKGLDYERPGVRYHVEQAQVSKENHPKKSSSALEWNRQLKERKRLTADEAASLAEDSNSILGKDADLEDDGAFGGRLLSDDKDRWQHNAWDHVEPPAEHKARIQSILQAQAEHSVPEEEAASFHQDPGSFWNQFYTSHENRFFKHRRWLHLEFPELIRASQEDAPPTKILEVGCGAGNTVFPLLEVNRNHHLEIFACDYSSEAVSVVKSNPLYSKPPCGHVRASVWDLASSGDPIDGIEPGTLDIIVLIFVFSALHPNEWTNAVRNVERLIKPGGTVLFRDYGRHDLPQLRFKKGRLLQDNFYVRGDGTRVYFFDPEELPALFNATLPPRKESASVNQGDSQILTGKSFETLQLAVDRRMLLNRKEKKEMYRVWLQAKLKRL